MLRFALRGRLLGCSELPVSESAESEAVEAFDSCKVLAREVVELLAVRLSRSLWNLRFVVESAGCSAEAILSE